jgi:DNA polymerase bacteriophage-type
VAYQFLHMDYETYSLVDLSEVGLHNYVNHPSTGISCMAWALDNEEIERWLPHVSKPPKKFLDALKNPNIIKVAWNAQFEFEFSNVVLPRYAGVPLDIPIEQWRDPIVLAHNLSLPGKLDSVASILKMKEQKDPRGDELKFMFCQPVSMGGEMTLFGIAPPLFRDHNSHPREFEEYVKYCEQDVRAERDLWNRLVKIPFPERDWRGWFLDQKINRFGMPGRRDLAEKGLRLALRYIKQQRDRMIELTGLKNVNSPPQMKAWAVERGYPWNSLRANFVREALENQPDKMTKECREVLAIRLTCTKSSYTKLERFLSLLSPDDRLRYQFRYMAAARTGRWAGGSEESASFQAQNMPRGMKAIKKRLALALQLLEAEDYDGIVREFTNTKNPKDSVTVIEFVITLLRSLFQATVGHKLLVSDLNAIENRVLGWAAGCKSILDVFRTCNECGHVADGLTGAFICPKCGCTQARCPYISFGTRLFNKEYAQMWKEYKAETSEDRQNSKPAVLGAGYGLGGGEMVKNEYGDMVRGGLWGYALSVCGVDMPKDLAHKAVKIFRDTYPEVVHFWTDLEEAFKQVLAAGGVIKVGEVTWDKQQREWVKHPSPLGCVLTFTRIPMEGGGYIVRMELPSGRALHYMNATLDAEQKISQRTGRPYTAYQLRYDGIEHSTTQSASGQQEKKRHKWGRVKTYGGKICENAIQAIARDLLLNGMMEADDMGFLLWGLFHDELAAEVPIMDFGGLRLSDLIWCMSQVPVWAAGLILGAEGFEGLVYRKG